MRVIILFFVSLFVCYVTAFSQDQVTIKEKVAPSVTAADNMFLKKFVRYEDLPNYCHSVTSEMIQRFLKAKNVSDLSSQMDISPFFSGIEELEKKVDDNFSKMKPNDYFMLCSAYQTSWGIVKRLQLWDKDDKDYRERVVQQFKRSLAKQGPHYLSMVTLLWFDIATPEELAQLKTFAWNYIEKSEDLLVLESFCNMLQQIDPHTKNMFGNAEDIKKLAIFNRHIDITTASGKRAIQITSHTWNVIECYLDPTRLGDGPGLPTVVLQVTHAEVEKLGPIIFLDEKAFQEREKAIKERAEAKARQLRAIAEAPELAKRLMLDEPGRLKAMNIIGNIQEPEEVRREMKFALWQYYGIRVNPVPNVKATPKEVQKIRELLKTENEQVKSDILDILSAAQCVSLIPDLFEMCYSKKIPPYRGFGTIAIAPKKTVYFQYSPTQIISYLGNEQVIPELEKLANSATVSEAMKQDSRLAIDIIKRRKAEEQEQLKRNEEVKRLLAERNIVVAEAGGPTDVKMNPFYDPTHKPDDSRQERPKNSRTWTSLEGWHSLNAVIIRKEADHIILVRDADEKEITVPIKRLSIQDQEYIKNWVSPDKIRKHSRTNNL